MSVKTEGNRIVKIIDRVLPELKPIRTAACKTDLLDFCRKLKGVGVDMLEVDDSLWQHMEHLSAELELIYRINCAEDISKVLARRFKHCVIDCNLAFSWEELQRLRTAGINITLEVRAEGVMDIESIEDLTILHNAHCIRVTGLNNITDFRWVKLLEDLKGTFGAEIDVCAENQYFGANAVALEAMIGGADFVTTSFSGFGARHGYAATDEVLAAASNILFPENKMDLTSLVSMGQLFESISGSRLHVMKPIIGRDVFKYESGIHADGIEKDPSTYEPFDPGLVGQKRALVIGKHSGKSAVLTKLKELNISCGSNDLDGLLDNIREKSIGLGRSLYDSEITELLRSSTKLWDQRGEGNGCENCGYYSARWRAKSGYSPVYEG